MRRLFSRLGTQNAFPPDAGTAADSSSAPASPLAPPGTRHAYAFVALRRDALVPMEKLRSALARWLPGEAIHDLRGDDRWLMFKSSTSCFMIALAPVPLPWNSLAGPCSRARDWPQAIGEMRGHRAHLMVLVSDLERDALDQACRLTRVVAALLEAHDAAGVAWGGDRVVSSPARFLGAAATASRERPPVSLWIECAVQVAAARGVVLVRTRGLRHFGSLELETVESTKPETELVALVCETAAFLLRSGPGQPLLPQQARPGTTPRLDRDGQGEVLRLAVQ